MKDINRVKKNCAEGKPSLGTYATLSPTAVEIAAIAGFDFVRLDPYHVACSPEVLGNMVRAAYAHGVTPWARVRNDPYEIMTALDLGVQAITVPNCGTVAAARAAVAAVHYPPLGEREMSRPLRLRNLTGAEYLEWSRTQLMLSVQIEGSEGLQNYRDIVRVEGVDCIQTGRNDLSQALGVPGENLHPKVLDAEKRIVEAALEAGKQVSLVHSLNDDGLERAARWIEQGVRIMTVDSDYMVLLESYRKGLSRLRR
jgi:4-hydroxy-2-oxoheptanedioate aldolase